VVAVHLQRKRKDQILQQLGEKEGQAGDHQHHRSKEQDPTTNTDTKDVQKDLMDPLWYLSQKYALVDNEVYYEVLASAECKDYLLSLSSRFCSASGTTSSTTASTSGMFRSQARRNHHNFTLVIAPIMNEIILTRAIAWDSTVECQFYG